MSAISVSLAEWQQVGPEERRELGGWSFGADREARELAARLTERGLVEVLELASGLRVRASSFVGRIQLGDLSLTVTPKLNGAPFLNLLRYAYGLRDLDLHQDARYSTLTNHFQDLLIHQLAAETEELLRTGLHRDYVRRQEELASPRGRIDFSNFVRTWTPIRTTLPCAYHPRNDDHVLNRALLAGLAKAHELSTDLDLRARLMRLIQTLRETVELEGLTLDLLRKARTRLDRRVIAYESSLTVIELLLAGEGVSFEHAEERVSLPGFLFDMNRFFQRLLSRFLHDYLAGYEVEDEFRLKEMFTYDPMRNPLGRRSPVQRPDFLIRRNSDVVAVIDAKYRDLWETRLPRDMLYQLALYALGRKGAQKSAVILYPTLNSSARDQAVLIREPARGHPLAEVIVRPIDLTHLEALLRVHDRPSELQKQRLAAEWAFGRERRQVTA